MAACGCGRKLRHRGWCWYNRRNGPQQAAHFQSKYGYTPKLTPAVLTALIPLREELVEAWTAPVLDLARVSKVLITIQELTGFTPDVEHRSDAQIGKHGKRNRVG